MIPDPTASSLTRRDAIKLFGAGAAMLSLGTLISKPSGGHAPAGAGTPQPFVLPPLGYAYDALEPHIDARTMQIHYTKHHQAYVTNANKALADHPELRALTAEAILANLDSMPESIRAALRNNVGGHVNHSFFWRIIAPPAPVGRRADTLASAIKKTFGTSAAFKARFTDAALKLFGSGWAWLSVKNGVLVVHATPNQVSPLSEGVTPVIGLDVWEHAYYLKHQNVRPDYVAAFWEVLNWDQAEANYAATIAA